MKTRIIEATVGRSLWSVFLVGQFDHERRLKSAVDGYPFIRGDAPGSFVLFDLYTKEGAVFSPTGHVKADLRKHAIWTGPLYEPFLVWLREQLALGVTLEDMPGHVELTTSTESCRHEGPMDALLKLCLKSTDKEVVDGARSVWAATYGSPPPGTPPTLADVRQWLGDSSIPDTFSGDSR